MILLFTEWWKTLGFIKQTGWLAALVFSLLLFILLIMNLFEVESEQSASANKRSYQAINPRNLLSFFTAFSWTLLISTYFSLNYIIGFSIASTLGLGAVWIVRRSTKIAAPGKMGRSHNYMESTGRVLKPIPSHRNGFGKVQLDYGGGIISIEAMTAGTELKPGDTVRVVQIIEGRILVVEPFRKNKQYPHEAD